MSTIETLTSLDARAQRGLGGDEAKARLRGQGANEVPSDGAARSSRSRSCCTNTPMSMSRSRS